MCGIAGTFAYRHAALPVDRHELRAMRDRMTARGPDGAGEWYSADHRVGLAHRRLAIIDLSERAAQPMASDDGRLVITFNGEIYNHCELRRDLEARGHRFRTDSDTEVLLHLYADKGEAMLHDLRGMFAFGLWDARKQALLLARDPYGIKPLYLQDDGRTCRFASQVKALLTSPRVSRVQEPAGLVGFYLFGSVPEPYTLYQEIRAVPAGSYQWVDAAGPRTPARYVSIADIWAEAEQAAPLPAEALRETVRAAVRDSVQAHRVADVPVGAFLSAGIDSGALVGLMSESAGPAPMAPIHTITLAFEEFRGTHADEAPLAEQLASRYGTRHTTRTVGEQEFRADLPRILDAMDQPSIDGINTWFVAKAASEAGLKVAVSGLGGDELFGGYPSFRDIPRWVQHLRLPAKVPGLGWLTEQLLATFAPLAPNMNPKARGLLRYGGRWEGAYLLKRGLFLPSELPALLDRETVAEGLRRLQPLAHIRRQLAGAASPTGAAPPPRTRAAYTIIATLEASLYMRNQLLRDTDWAGMAHSVEIRVPLVDAWLLRKLAGPLAAAGLGNHKRLLAATPRPPLPETVATRAKSGFTTPIADWQKRRRGSPSTWRDVPILTAAGCPWARRWGYEVAHAGTA